MFVCVMVFRLFPGVGGGGSFGVERQGGKGHAAYMGNGWWETVLVETGFREGCFEGRQV